MMHSHSPRLAVAATSATQSVIEKLEARTFLSSTPAPTPAEIVAQADNAFAFDLLHKLAPDTAGNLFFSPYSAATALEMTLQGAKGATASEMIQALHLPGSDMAQAGITALDQLFQAAPATSGYTLSTANRLWVNENFPLLDSFLSDTQKNFGAAPQSVDFSDPATAANTVNTWVSDQTHGKITNLIPASALHAYTALVLTNALYFQGNWASAFDSSLTHAAPFQISTTQGANAQMMEQTTDFGYYAQGGEDGFQALDLPYVGGGADMLVILPTTYDVNAFESTLSADVFAQITNSLAFTNVDVSLPKFELNETYDLSGPLQSLGIKTAFTRAADFSGISATPSKIDSVIQKSYVSVDETGTEAAAATGIIVTVALVMPTPTPPISFNADHPFIFAIRDRATNTILFLGSVADPSVGMSDFATPPTALTDPITPTTTTPIVFSPAPTAGVTTTDLTVGGTVDRKFTGNVGVLGGGVSHVPRLADLSGTIQWGDNSSSPAHFIRLGNGSIAVRGSHIYADAGNFNISIDVTQTPYGKGEPTVGSALAMPEMGATALIAESAISRRTTPGGLAIQVTAGTPFTATLASIDLPALPSGVTRGATVHWGDGSHSPGTLTADGAAFDISASHLYHSHRQFPILIDVWQKSHGKLTILAHVRTTASVTA